MSNCPCHNVTCSGVTRKTSPATSAWFQIVQTDSVCYNYHVGCIPLFKPWMVGKFWLTQYAEMDKWFTNKLLPTACPCQIENIDLVDYNSLHCWCVLNPRSVGCRWRLVPCFAGAGHKFEDLMIHNMKVTRMEVELFEQPFLATLTHWSGGCYSVYKFLK